MLCFLIVNLFPQTAVRELDTEAAERKGLRGWRKLTIWKRVLLKTSNAPDHATEGAGDLGPSLNKIKSGALPSGFGRVPR
jgi:hypothetical protein